MSSFIRSLCAAAFAVALGAVPVAASEQHALAQLGDEGALVTDEGGSVVLTVPLTQSVPWKVQAMDAPPRIVLEMNDVVWSRLPEIQSEGIVETRVRRERPGWTQLELVLREPLSVGSAEMVSAADGTAVLELRLMPTTADEFRKAADPEDPEAGGDQTISGGERIVVAVDPGHGGIDPGAISGELVEAELMLTVARRLKEALVRTGRFDVVLTREEDVFVPLEARLTRARAAGADVFLSLHADTLAEDDGAASGMTVYRLSEDAAEAADVLLAERHAPSDLLTGVDLTGAGDDVALALMDIARRETEPRTRSLQGILVQSFEAAGLHVNSRPERDGNLSVLKSAEIPSVLIELGFLSSDADRERLASEDWQGEATLALTEALLRWADEDRLRPGALQE